MKIQYNSVIGVPVEDLNSQCIQCCFLDISGFDKCLPYPGTNVTPIFNLKNRNVKCLNYETSLK